ncbi:preprotein translocase subunit SecG [Calycomorphotria hydatis]|uniref:Protein-export membrane protein SecG n=1 Tax=Calycomorphotria hydatis TaxID=2528027 RepID=A0A517TC57_9PLAN|nr:preprotein translocase subunit SecG [Calycomorphotria hydatis]QDT65954.1 preprotein translocase subunit SecG [Calycomorphotria hydatis]
MEYFWSYVSMTLLMLVGLFLMFIVLLQRGRGGGLAGAFGGAGGQSALGTKAGDVFTKITIGIAVVWVVLAALCGFALRAETGGEFSNPSANIEEIEPPVAGESGADPFADLPAPSASESGSGIGSDLFDAVDEPKGESGADSSESSDAPK